MTRDDVRANLASWDAYSEEYQRKHAEQLNTDWDRLTWGTWAIPEDEIHALGDVAGIDALELGCGAAQFGIRVAKRGANVTGLDFSANQLVAARPHIVETGVRFPLVRANAEELPFADGSFDLVFCDHGALGFTDPAVTIPEVARVLRPDGRLVCSTATPFIWVTWPMVDGPPGRELLRSYYDSTRMAWDPAEPEVVEFQPTYGEWIRLFRDSRLVVEDLIELRPEPDADSSFQEYATLEWARDFPAEHIWKVRKESS
jgi:ubiquinone/menaquinone biosynthesis C-methylase UbiE